MAGFAVFDGPETRACYRTPPRLVVPARPVWARLGGG
jgi:hypothetical protein